MLNRAMNSPNFAPSVRTTRGIVARKAMIVVRANWLPTEPNLRCGMVRDDSRRGTGLCIPNCYAGNCMPHCTERVPFICYICLAVNQEVEHQWGAIFCRACGRTGPGC